LLFLVLNGISSLGLADFKIAPISGGLQTQSSFSLSHFLMGEGWGEGGRDPLQAAPQTPVTVMKD
jgi:hypothetical protein